MKLFGAHGRAPVLAIVRATLTAAAVLVPGLAVAADETVPAALTVRNESGAPIACEAAIAHWFWADFGQVEVGESVVLPLRRAPDGTVALTGPTGEAMAVEALWCGRPGRVWQSRAAIDLPRVRPADGDWPEEFVCTDTGQLRCPAVSSAAAPQ